MSSRTPEECVELAVDSSAGREEREAAIDELKTANECDELADILSNDDLETRYRRRALRAVATRQCEATLERLVEERSLESSLRDEAESLLQELDSP